MASACQSLRNNQILGRPSCLWWDLHPAIACALCIAATCSEVSLGGDRSTRLPPLGTPCGAETCRHQSRAHIQNALAPEDPTYKQCSLCSRSHTPNPAARLAFAAEPHLFGRHPIG